MNQKPTILVADDSRAFLMYISVLLNRMYYVVIPVESGKETIELSEKIRPHVIMLDIDMPKMDGMMVLKHLKNDLFTRDIPVIMMDAQGKENIRAECFRLGCTGYIKKPVELLALHEALTACFALRGGNKRKHLRTVYTKKVMLTYRETMSEHQTQNLSVGGAYIVKKEPLPPGMDLTVELPLRNDRLVRLDGTVLYTKSSSGQVLEIAPGMAVGFKNISERDRAILNEYITYSLTRDLPGIKF